MSVAQVSRRVRPSVVEDCRYVAAHLRVADREELAAAAEGWDGPLHALLESYQLTPRPVTFEIEGLPAAMLGIAPFPGAPGVGCPWLLGTDALSGHKSWFLRESRASLKTLSSGFVTLVNDIDLRYTRTIRWLEWLGFRPVGLTEGREPQRLPFVRMEWRA